MKHETMLMDFSIGYEDEAETSTRHGSWVIFEGTARDSDGNSPNARRG